MRPSALNSQISSIVIRKPDTGEEGRDTEEPAPGPAEPGVEEQHRGDGHAAQPVEPREGRDGGPLLDRLWGGLGRSGALARWIVGAATDTGRG